MKDALLRPRALVAMLVFTALAACASSGEKASAAEDKPVDIVREDLGPQDDEGIVHDTKVSAAEQLDCPLEQVSFMCKRRDDDGMCSAVVARGCERELEYDFGGE